MSYGTTSIDPGSTPSVAVARDLVAGAMYQRVKLSDATEDATTAIGVDANPLRTLPRRRGTSDYDSGRVVATMSSAAVTTATVYVERIFLSNVTDTQRYVTLTNTAGAEYLSQMVLAPRETRVLDLGSLAMVGIKVQAEANSAIALQIVGAQ
jgi:hypothetical protein